MIEARNIEKSYGDLKVLKDINIRIEQGEMVSIVGASGAGKTTLLQILGTIEQPDKGQVLMQETDVFALKSRELAEFRNRNIGFIFQFHHLLPEFNALENVCIPAFIGRKNRQEVEKRGKELLDYLGLSHRLKHKPSQMSGGEQQRVAVARALINNPRLILADEPTGNLDSKNAGELHQLFLNIREEFNNTFIIITHNFELAGLGDRTLQMADGYIKKAE